jgi:hypothetical protein
MNASARENEIHLLMSRTKMWQQLTGVQKYQSKIWEGAVNCGEADDLIGLNNCMTAVSHILLYINFVLSFSANI